MALISVTFNGKQFDPDKLKEGVVRVGFFESSKYEGGKSVADVARYNEFGLGVPRRSFMRPAVFGNQHELVNLLRTNYKRALKDNDDTMQVLEKFGLYCKGLIQKEIITGNFKPNAPSTIKRKGFNAPLRDTTLMLHSVSYQAEEIKK